LLYPVELQAPRYCLALLKALVNQEKKLFAFCRRTAEVPSSPLPWPELERAFEFSVAGPALGVELSRCVQIIGVVAFMDADCLLLPVRTKQRLKAGGPLLGLGDAAVAIILAERIVSHGIYL
jgi:hypothetical protein